jgi:dihydrofolate synthase/folylpolyglutamate synthase
VSVINSIGYDHTEIFGDTLTEIANEKAGIIQENNAVFTVKQDDEARVVIEAEVAKKHASLTTIHPKIDSSSTVPPFQQQNFTLALAATEYIACRDNLAVPPEAAQIINQVTVPGRFEVYKLSSKTILLDGAHNPQKLEALTDVLRQRNMQPAVVVAAFSEAPEKKVAECIRLLSSYAERTIYTTFTVKRDVTRRSVGLDRLSKLVNSRDEYIEEPAAALDKALSGDEHYVIVTGSLYLVSMLRPLLQQRAGF